MTDNRPHTEIPTVPGLKVDYRTVWEFVHAEKLSYKKRR